MQLLLIILLVFYFSAITNQPPVPSNPSSNVYRHPQLPRGGNEEKQTGQANGIKQWASEQLYDYPPVRSYYDHLMSESCPNLLIFITLN